MSDENILAFNVTNLVTVSVIGAIMFTLFGFALTWWQNRQGA